MCCDAGRSGKRHEPTTTLDPLPTDLLKSRLHAMLRLLLLGLAWGLVTTAAAADSRTAQDEQSLERRLAAVEMRKDIDGALKTRIVDLYRQAIAETQAGQRLREETAELRRQVAGAAEAVRELERNLEALEKKEPGPLALPNGQADTLEQLERMEFQLRTQAEAASRKVAELDRSFEETATRPLEVRRQQDELRAAIDSGETALRDPGRRAAASRVAEAQHALARARQEARQRQLERTTQELAYQPFLLRLTQLQRDAARIEAERAEADLRQVRERLEQRRLAAVEAARQEAQRKRQEADLPPPIKELEAGNAELSATLGETALAINRALGETSALRTELAEVEADLRLLQRRAETPDSDAELGTALIRNLTHLPTADRFASGRGQREALLRKTTEANLAVERDLAALADMKAAADRRIQALGTVSEDSRPALEASLRRQLAERRNRLARLDNLQDELVRTLRQAEEAELDLLSRSASVRATLTSLLFSIPVAPIGPQAFADLGSALAWLTAPGNWRSLADAVAAAVRHFPGRFGALLLVTAALLGWRPRLKAYLATLTPGAVSLEQFHVAHTLGALGITLLLALPWALLAWGTGTLLYAAPSSGAFASAVAIGLVAAGVWTLVGQGFVWLLDHRGVAVNHFGWVAETAHTVKAELRRLLRVYVPLAFIAVTASASQDSAISHSLGRLALMLVLGIVSLFWARNMRPEQPFIRRDAGTGAGVLPRPLARGAYWMGIALPLALALLAAVGYYFAAAALYQLLTRTLLLWMGGIMLYGLVALWTLVQHARLTQRGDDAPPVMDSAEGAIVRRRALDIASIGGQTRQMLNMLITLVFVTGLYAIWHGAVPALEVVGDVALWSYTDTVDGEKVTRSLTLGGLFLALAVVGVTGIAARNVGGMLDSILLKRLELQPDANYAIKTVSRYAIGGVGIVAAASLFGISWSSVQWLVAALGVGLGFGLQEIVANFVSGLIVLAERPIRVGDTITVGEVTGNVSRIRARATLITDFDNKEVLIPNKAFITERVVNWTLSSQVTRVLIKVGVAYGTDPIRAQETILAAVRSAPLALNDPAPSVYFVAFGESSLDFEVRVFADGMDKRLPLAHQVNTAIGRALAQAGIEIPFPQRDLHIRCGVAATDAGGETVAQT
jgi:potassium efflux system protein